MYAYLGPSQIEALSGVLERVVREGARLVTYGYHMTFPDRGSDVDEIAVKSSVGDLLRMYYVPEMWGNPTARAAVSRYHAVSHKLAAVGEYECDDDDDDDDDDDTGTFII